jgi:hypothetical protein
MNTADRHGPTSTLPVQFALFHVERRQQMGTGACAELSRTSRRQYTSRGLRSPHNLAPIHAVARNRAAGASGRGRARGSAAALSRSVEPCVHFRAPRMPQNRAITFDTATFAASTSDTDELIHGKQQRYLGPVRQNRTYSNSALSKELTSVPKPFHVKHQPPPGDPYRAANGPHVAHTQGINTRKCTCFSATGAILSASS